MKTIKIIDLLSKIANGEEVPKKIKYDTLNYYFRGYDYKEYDIEKDYIDEQTSFIEKIDFYKLHDEVEIIEEDKKIERITNEAFLNSPFGELVGGKFNEIIDYINKNEEEK